MVLIILPVVVSVGVALAVNGGNYQRKAKSSTRIFRPPLAGAVAAVTVPVWTYLVLRFMPLDRAAAVLFWRGVPSHPQLQGALLVNALVIGGIYWATLLWFGRKWLVALDSGRQTWRSLDMSEFPWRVKTGPWAELGGVQVIHRVGGRATSYFVRLVWRPPGLAGLYGCLGKFSLSAEAAYFAARMSRELNLPELPAQEG